MVNKILITILISIILYFGYMFQRNSWVYETRTYILNQDMTVYDQLPSYDFMMYNDIFEYDVETIIEAGKAAEQENYKTYENLIKNYSHKER